MPKPTFGLTHARSAVVVQVEDREGRCVTCLQVARRGEPAVAVAEVENAGPCEIQAPVSVEVSDERDSQRANRVSLLKEPERVGQEHRRNGTVISGDVRAPIAVEVSDRKARARRDPGRWPEGPVSETVPDSEPRRAPEDEIRSAVAVDVGERESTGPDVPVWSVKDG